MVFGHTYGDIEEQIAFAQLHYFLVGDFFSGHDSFSVLLPDGASLEYRVVSALVFNDAPILSSSGYFEDPEVLRAYFGFVSSGGGLEGQVREGAPLDAASDRIVQLETCELSADGTARLVVTGVLAGEGSWR